MRIQIIGLGSLLSEESARNTCPDLRNFRFAKLRGYKRIFNKTDSTLALNEQIPPHSKKYACLSAIPDQSIREMFVSVFDIPQTEWDYFLYREFEYRIEPIAFYELGSEKIDKAYACLGDFKSDQECFEYISGNEIRKKRLNEFRQKYTGPMWRYDIEPNPVYLYRCLNILEKDKPEFLDNFLDTTFTGAGHSIRSYLKKL
ncbi:MAG: hypothetical protein AAF549_00020 [Pseudomonadota bacterium]